MWGARTETLDVGGTGNTPDEAVTELARDLLSYGGRDAPLLSSNEQLHTARWLTHWAWKLKPKKNRPRLETYTVEELLSRGSTPESQR